MQITDSLKEQLNGWDRYLGKFIESSDMDDIIRTLKARKGKVQTAPDSSDLFRAYKLCPPDKMKVIIAGISPYHTFTKDGMCVADGVALSCSKTKILQPSLENLYCAWEDEYNNKELDVDMDKNPDLSYLAEQGVLLYNVALTVQKDRACSDIPLWSKFNKYMWETINELWTGIPIILLGSEAWKSEQYINPLRHYIFKLSHPASAAYQGTIWSSEGVFRKVDKILMDNNKDSIQWYRKRNWIENRYTWEELSKSKEASEKGSLQKEWEQHSDLPWN